VGAYGGLLIHLCLSCEKLYLTYEISFITAVRSDVKLGEGGAKGQVS